MSWSLPDGALISVTQDDGGTQPLTPTANDDYFWPWLMNGVYRDPA